MNPPLSYMPASSVGTIEVTSGITSVSLGGDSIGSAIIVKSDPPLFALPGKGIAEAGAFSSYYRSNNHARGAALTASVASSNLSFGIAASHDKANDYVDGHGNTVTSTYYESNNLGMTLAAKTDNSLFTLKAGHQSIPAQGFVNQWMDMTGNDSSYANLGYKGDFDWGKVEATGYWQNTWHEMNSGPDKLSFPMHMMPDMPMNTHGISLGYTLKTEIQLSDDDILRLGSEFHRFTLDDWWPPVYTTKGSMWPNTFLSINNGLKERFALYAEWEGRLSSTMSATLGVRNEQVHMDTDDVAGYNGMYDPANFNNQPHARNDSNWNVSALLKYEPDAASSYDFGYSMKSRSPNLYERYAWSTRWMATGMIGWFGDGNGYVGNLDLMPEIAHTISLTAGWRDADKNNYELKVTPYYTYINNYIGVEKIGVSTSGNQNILKFVNQNAVLFGIDVSGRKTIWESDGFGTGQLSGTIGYVHGKNTSTGARLYHMMPLNMRLSVEQRIGGWTNAIETQLVDDKSNVDPLRYEPKTFGYAIVNLRTAYQYKNMRIDCAVMNLFDRFYYLPLGGINYDQSLATYGRPYSFNPLAGQGRSFNIALTQSF
ncbi:MAG: TonB-dependent receptor [Chlorobaculum sp.]